MEKLILSIYPKSKHPTYEMISLLLPEEKISVGVLRERLFKLDLTNLLVLCLDSEVSKLFKEDYGFNDHGIYFDVYYNSAFDEQAHLYAEKIKKLKTKLSKKYKQETESSLELEGLKLVNRTSQYAFTLVPLEKASQKRDYERWLNYDAFVDPVVKYQKQESVIVTHTCILDIETTGLDFEGNSITMIGIKPLASMHHQCISNPTVTQIKNLLIYLEGKTIIGHNLIFDLSWLMYASGSTFVPNINTVDTLLLAHVAGERRLSLKHLSMMYGNFKGRRNTMNADENYLLEDLLATELLYEKFKHKLDTFSGQLVCQAVKTFSEVKVNGIALDKTRLFEIRDTYKQYDTPKYEFNVDSNRELADYLIAQGVPLVDKTERGDWKVDQKTLENFNNLPVVSKYLEYQKEVTIYQKFIKPYCELQNFMIRPDIRLSGTETGRLSCNNPNVQQIPNRSLFKDIFRSRFESEGFIGSIDLDQAELRIAALLANDQIYAQALLSNDFHKLVASKSFGITEKEVTKAQRFAAKTVNFGGVLYGGSAKGIAWRIKVDTSVVQTIQAWYKKEFIGLTNWIEGEKELAVQTSYSQTYFGRERSLRELRWDQKRRIGVNTAVQSVASDVMLYIVVRLSGLIRKNKLKSKVMFPVHDELLLDIHKSELDKIIELLKQAFKDVLKTPLGKLGLTNVLPVSGSLEWGKSWLYVKNEKFPSDGSTKISSLEGVNE